MANNFTPVNSGQRQISLVEIDCRGDVYLLLSKITLRVSSRILSLVSDVFCVMFQSENFVEGQTLLETGSCRVPLPADDPKAMQAICLILHHRPAQITWDITVSVLEEIARLGDKYACSGALSLWGQFQMVRLIKEPVYNAEDNVSLLYVAYTLDLAIQFTEISRRMVFSKHKATYQNSYRDELLPCGILSKLAPIGAFTSAAIDFCTIHA